MVLGSRHSRRATWTLSVRRRRATRCFAGVGVTAALVFGAVMPAVAATPPTLGVVIVGSGRVTSQPTGIVCPGKCTATFVAGTRVVLTPKPENGSTFLRWGGACTGTAACTVTMTSLTAVAAQFVGGPKVQPQPATKYIAAPGAYSGQTSQGGTGGVSFFVAPGGASLLNISIPSTAVLCTPGGSKYDDQLWISQAAIKPNGSFTATGSQVGVWVSYQATFTYSLAGNFEAATAKGPASAAGSFRENVTYLNGTTNKCTTNNQTWTAAPSGPTPAQRLAGSPGAYSGQTSQGGTGGVTFSVGPGGASLMNISIPATAVLCTPGGSKYDDQLAIAQAVVKPDGSFIATGAQQGVFQGAAATFKYYFAGNFEGLNTNGVSIAAGPYREDIKYTSKGTNYACTTNVESWTAMHS